MFLSCSDGEIRTLTVYVLSVVPPAVGLRHHIKLKRTGCRNRTHAKSVGSSCTTIIRIRLSPKAL